MAPFTPGAAALAWALTQLCAEARIRPGSAAGAGGLRARGHERRTLVAVTQLDRDRSHFLQYNAQVAESIRSERTAAAVNADNGTEALVNATNETWEATPNATEATPNATQATPNATQAESAATNATQASASAGYTYTLWSTSMWCRDDTLLSASVSSLGDCASSAMSAGCKFFSYNEASINCLGYASCTIPMTTNPQFTTFQLREVTENEESMSEMAAELNVEALNVVEQIDQLKLECRRQQEAAEGELRRVRGEIPVGAAALASSLAVRTAAVQAAQGEKRGQDATKREGLQMGAQCDLQLGALRTGLAALEADVGTIEDLQPLKSQCGGADAASLVQQLCGLAHRQAAPTVPAPPSAAAALGVGNATGTAAAHPLPTLRTQSARRALQVLLQAVAMRGGQVNATANGHRSHPRGRAAAQAAPRHGRAAALLQVRSAASRARVWPGRRVPLRNARRQNARACKRELLESTDCDALASGLMVLRGKLRAGYKQGGEAIAERQAFCQRQASQESVQLDMSHRHQADIDVTMDRLIGDKDSLEQMQNMRRSTGAMLQSKLEQLESDCQGSAAEKEAEFSKILMLRQVEYQSLGFYGRINDCVVSDWAFGPCSQTCMPQGGGAGQRDAFRTMLSAPDARGLPCPPLQLAATCGTSPCPRDCEMGAWGPWSPCPVQCGGGSRSRTREMFSKAKNGGTACPAAEERQACGVGSCDADCRLDDWSGWSDCSKACKVEQDLPAGRRLRRRAVRSPAVGGGVCPREGSQARLEAQKCGGAACPTSVACDVAQDVVLLLQGSDGANLSAQLALAAALLANSSEQVRYGVIAYGGSPQVLAGLQDGRAEAGVALASAAAPGGDPDLAQGILAAGAMLASQSTGGRKQVLLVLSDGLPTTFGRARTALHELEQTGVRPVLGLADGYFGDARQRACRLVGEPCAAFVEAVHGWSYMASEPKRFLAAVCSAGLTAS